MEQRPLRLGDIVDDYCPRERRITNHVIVALVDDAIRQTRCGTCDTEHVYKAARMPRRRLKGAEGDEATAEAPGQLVSRHTPEVVAPAPVPAPPAESPRAAPIAAAPGVPDGAAAPAPEQPPVPAEHADDVWPTHRRLIRATLPRVEGEEKTPRPIPEFTMHQRQGRGGNGYRGDYFGNGNGNGNGNNRGNGGGGFRPGQPGGQRREQGGGGQPGSGGGGGKRWHRRRRGRGGPKAN
jgi:hypothetical protein